MLRTAGAVVVLVLVLLPELILPTRVCKMDEITVTDSQGSVSDCIPCQHCPEGLELYPKCGSRITKKQKESSPFECRACKPGFFSKKLDVDPCEECQHCLKTRAVIKECTNMSDTVCGKKCGRGFYYENSSLDCQQCSCCCGDTKDVKIQKCINDNKPATHHCTSHRLQECCKVPPVSTRGQGNTEQKLTAGSIAVIVLAAVVSVALGIAGCLLCLWCRKRKRRESSGDMAEVQFHKRQTIAQSQEQGHQTSRESEETRVNLPPYEQASGSEPVMNGDVKQNRVSNAAFVSSQPGTPDIKEGREEAQATLTQLPCPQEIKRQMSTDSHTSTSSDTGKTGGKGRRSGSISSAKEAISEMKQKLSTKQRSYDKAMLVHEEQDVYLPEDQTFRLSDLDLCEREKVGNMLQSQSYGVGNYIHIATAYKMEKLRIENLKGESNRGEKVIEFINSRYPNETVYDFCKVLQEKSIERNDIVEELCNYIHLQKTVIQPTSDGNKSYV